MSQHVVVVDDTDFNLRVMTEMVRKLDDVLVHPFAAAAEALAWSATHDVDCVVTDYLMPDMDGIALTRELRRVPALALTPIIMVTVHHERSIRYEALDAGVNDFIERPIDQREFQARTSTFLALQRARRRLALHVDELTASLVLEEQRVRQHARRLESLWQITTSDNPSEDILARVLAQSAAALRPGEPFIGHFSRVDGDAAVVEIVAADQLTHGPEMADMPDLRAVGERVPLETSQWREAAESNRTIFYDDLRQHPELMALKMISRMQWRSAILKAFPAGGTTYIVMFLSQRVTARPFEAEDVAFVEIVASIFQAHVQQRWQSERIRFQLEHDPLTGVWSRSRFRSMGRMTAVAGPVSAVAIVDLETFREVNNAYGSLTGDALLVEVAAALERVAQAGEGDTIGRLGGDKFGIWMPVLQSEDNAAQRVATYRRIFEHPFSTGDREGRGFISLEARIGVALRTHSATSFDDLMSQADAALYVSKNGRGVATSFFVPGMEADFRDRKRLAAELLEAIAHEQLTLYLQPHVELKTMRVVGAEALVRWEHPDRGLVLPKDFIPFAEANGMIGQVDAWVLGRATAIAQLIAADYPRFRLFFNISPIDLDAASLIEQLNYVLRSGLGKNLGIELTESGLMRDTRATMHMTESLQSHGVRIAIDDFGTGYSSLSYLKRLPFDLIKIDQSFVGNLPGDRHDRAICDAILSIGARFDKAVLAEGVENNEQLTWLRERGCTYAQGYFICEPLTLDDFLRWLPPPAADSSASIPSG